MSTKEKYQTRRLELGIESIEALLSPRRTYIDPFTTINIQSCSIRSICRGERRMCLELVYSCSIGTAIDSAHVDCAYDVRIYACHHRGQLAFFFSLARSLLHHPVNAFGRERNEEREEYVCTERMYVVYPCVNIVVSLQSQYCKKERKKSKKNNSTKIPKHVAVLRRRKFGGGGRW